MGGGQVRIVCLGLPDRSDLASRVAESSNLIGSEVEFAIEVGKGEDVDQGSIDWRGSLSSANWLVVPSSCALGRKGVRGAWGASLAFSELEGSKTAMVVEVPSDSTRMNEAWGAVIERIRQIGVLYLTNEAMVAITKIEKAEGHELLHEIRKRGMVPLVCSFNPGDGVAEVSHSLGGGLFNVAGGFGEERWLAGFLSRLSTTGHGPSGIESAARSEYP